MELALGRFPLDAECKSLTILELLQHIVNEPLPTLPRRDFPEDFCNFVDIWYVTFFFLSRKQDWIWSLDLFLVVGW
jgi:hypothetical protein